MGRPRKNPIESQPSTLAKLAEPPPGYVIIAEASAKLGIERARLYRSIDMGHIQTVETVRGRAVLIADAKREAERLANDPAVTSRKRRADQLPDSPDAPADPETRLKAAKAELAELDLRQRKGELVELGEVSALIDRAGRAMRERLIAMPARVTDDLETQRKLAMEIDAACHAFGADLRRATP